MRGRVMLVCCGVVGLLASRSVQAQNVVTNPGFESGFSGWTENGVKWFLPTGSGGYDPGGGTHGGTGKAITVCGGVSCMAADPAILGAWLYQDLNTVVGQSYTLSFWLYSNGASTADRPVQFRALFGNTVAADFTALPTSDVFTQYFNTVPLIATSTTTRLELLGRDDPSYLQLDDISVTASTTTPEPSSMALVSGGLLAMLAVTRRTRRRH